MAKTIRDVMTRNPVTLPDSDSCASAAKAMQQKDIGDVLVLRKDGSACGIVTDRDIVVRAIAQGRDPGRTRLDDVCSHALVSCKEDDSIDDAVELMRKNAVRRLPVLDANGSPVGVVSLGDLARERDPDSVLGKVSTAPPNN